MTNKNQNGPDQQAETNNGFSIIRLIRDLIPSHVEHATWAACGMVGGTWITEGLDDDSQDLVELYYDDGPRDGEPAYDVPAEQRRVIIDSALWAICDCSLPQLHAIAVSGGNIDMLDIDACFAFSRAAYEKAEADRKPPTINTLAE